MNPILETAKFVVDRSDFVKINHERLVEFAKGFSHKDIQHWMSAAPFDFSDLSDEQILHFVILFNVLSFCYWGEPKWTIKYRNESYDGAWGMIVAIGRGIEEGFALLDFGYCAQISKEDFAHILRGNVEIPLFEERWNILRDVGRVMVERYHGNASELVAEAKGDAQKLVALLVEHFPSLKDASMYKGREISFSKRAQLLVADIYQIFNGQDLGTLADVDQLTACADYKLPQILRKLGVLEYVDMLAERIDAQIELDHGSPEEVELRANTIWAVDLITKEVQKHTPSILPFQVNDHLWLSTQVKVAGDKPYHRTRTTAY